MHTSEASHITRNVSLLCLLWTGLLAVSLSWNIYEQRQGSVSSAHLQAEVSISKDISFRSWSTSHGGVYVRPTEKSPPNPYLKVPDRDVVTTDGTRLTLINPAYMMRQLYEDFSGQYGINGHITSLKLVNPNNAPDVWEREALLAFERGVKERTEVVAAPDGERVLRYMRPFMVEPGCLKCHGGMGYKVGDVRGGISTIVHMGKLDAVAMKSIKGMLVTYGLVWLVGLLGIAISGRHFALRNAERERSETALKQANEEMEQRVRERTKDLSIANAQLSESVAVLKVHHREMQLINQLNDMLQTCQTLEEAYRVIGTAMQEVFSAAGGALAIANPSQHYLETRVSWGEQSCEAHFTLDECWAIRQGHQYHVKVRDESPLCRHFIRTPQGGHMCIPLIVQGEIMGLLYMEMKAECSHEVYEEQQQLAETIGEVIKLGLSNIRLRMALLEQATHDALTGLHNRRYLDENMPRELHRALRTKSPLSVVMIDIDYFKRINDTHGHEVGDIVLRNFGQLLIDNMRKSDIACRYGGEEFVIVMENSSLEDATQRTEQLRTQLKNMKLQYGTQAPGQVTISAGIAQMPEQGVAADKLLQMADEALYAAKQAGRDRVFVYEFKEKR